MVKDILDSYKVISDTLFKLIRSVNLHTTDAIINEVLQQIQYYLSGDRTYIFEIDQTSQTHSCNYEVVRGSTIAVSHELLSLPLSESPWWAEQILANRPIILDNINDLPLEAAAEKEVLAPQGIKSIVVIPLLSKSRIWGYIGIDKVDEYHAWEDSEIKWFTSVSKVLSICLELKRAEIAAINEKSRTQKLHANMPIGIMLLQPLFDDSGKAIDYTYKEANPAFTKILYPSQIFGRPRSEISAEFNQNIAYRTSNNDYSLNDVLFDGKVLDGDIGLMHSGALRHYHYIMYGSSQSELVLLFQDQTQIQNSNIKLAQFESMFNSIANSSGIGIFQWDILSSIFTCTDMWFRNLNRQSYTVRDLMEAHNLVHNDDLERLRTSLDSLLAGQNNEFQQDMRVRANDQWKWIRCDFKAEKENDNDTKPYRIVGMNLDITQQKSTEHSLVEAMARAEESDRMKSAFVANISHEIRTPLNAIVGFSELLTDSNDEQERREYISIIKQSNKTLLQLINDILDISKIEAGTYETLPEIFDLYSLCETVISSSRQRAGNGVTLVLDNEEMMELYSDKVRIKQILTNLVSNAIKFTISGSINIGYLRDGDQVKIYVRDTGCGISAENTGKIFKQFIKLNSFIQGTGLGLPICKNLVEKLGGHIWVDSKLDEGSCFWFTIPSTKS